MLVEGPLDALAITLTTRGAAIGLAPLGTALTHRQVDELARVAYQARQPITIATDGDDAGWRSAEHAYAQLALVDIAPDHLRLPAGMDPADLARTDPDALIAALDARRPLAEAMIERILGPRPAPPPTSDGIGRRPLPISSPPNPRPPGPQPSRVPRARWASRPVSSPGRSSTRASTTTTSEWSASSADDLRALPPAAKHLPDVSSGPARKGYRITYPIRSGPRADEKDAEIRSRR